MIRRKAVSFSVVCAVVALWFIANAAEGQTNRRIPGGYSPTAEETRQLRSGIDSLDNRLNEYQIKGLEDGLSDHLIADVAVLSKAVGFALDLGEFKDAKEIGWALELLAIGEDRMDALGRGEMPWLNAAGMNVIRGYKSDLDGSYQPYGLEVPHQFNRSVGGEIGLEVWLHGRDDSLSDIKFLHQRLTSRSPFQINDAIVLHPYGRYCNAFKFAGEVDVFEAIEAVCRDYPIDRDRIVLRGFSMGGGGVWHLAVHHADFWAAASPGAGFSETSDYLGLESMPPRPEWEKTLFHWYDATDYAPNLFQLPVVAYSGEVDKQIQAARQMESALADEGMKLAHVIGAGMGHKYDAGSIQAINHRIGSILRHRTAGFVPEIRWTGYTLRYPSMHWFRAERLAEHWTRAEARAATDFAQSSIDVKVSGVNAFSLTLDAGEWAGPVDKPVRVSVNGIEILTSPPLTDRSWQASFAVDGNGRWQESAPSGVLAKSPGLQGPIDDAFMSRFVAVLPEGQGFDAGIHNQIMANLSRFQMEWKAQFRGDVPVVSASSLTEADVASSNLILFGDPSSNEVIRKVMEGLPFRWDRRGIHTRTASYPATSYYPKMIFPNPLNPRKYIVLNSGFTFDRTLLGSNADQTPKLPDFAFIRINQDGSETISRAGFFDEQWKLPE